MKILLQESDIGYFNKLKNRKGIQYLKNYKDYGRTKQKSGIG